MPYDSDKLKQLGHPSGKAGVQILSHLNRVNVGINSATLSIAAIAEGHRVLELGFGGASLIESILCGTEQTELAGLDVSILAVREAIDRLERFITAGRLKLLIKDRSKFPFAEGAFDHVIAVNVIYFWSNPKRELEESLRVLKPNGKIVLSYAYGAPDGVTKFPPSKVENWLGNAGFVSVAHSKYRDRENGTYYCSTARKEAL